MATKTRTSGRRGRRPAPSGARRGAKRTAQRGGSGRMGRGVNYGRSFVLPMT